MDLSNELENYILSHIEDEDPVLSRLYRETHIKQLYPQMCSNHLQGSVLTLISKLISPRHILEIGTFTGYSAICLAKGLQKNGSLHTIEIDDELEEFAKGYFEEAGVKNQIVQHIGDAKKVIPNLQESFDLVFIDADKCEYIEYYELVLPKVNKGAVIVVDNTLWYGKVVLPDSECDEQARCIKKFNTMVKNDPRVETYLLPVRDGITILRKL